MSRALIVLRFIFIIGSLAHKYVLQLYMYICIFLCRILIDRLVALFTGVDKHVHYAWSAMYYQISTKSDPVN